MEPADKPEDEVNKSSSENNEENELERLAMEELLKEAKRGAERARDMGAVGWMKNPIPKTNKRFLTNTLVSTLKNLHSPSRKRPRIHEDSIQTRGDGRTYDSDRRIGRNMENISSNRHRSLSKYHKEKTRGSSSDYHDHSKKHKSKKHKSSKKNSSAKDSPKNMKSQKSGKHQHKKPHRKSKKKKDGKKEKQ